jgi:hypothetical protein
MQKRLLTPLLVGLALAGCQTLVTPPVTTTHATPSATASLAVTSPAPSPAAAASEAPSSPAPSAAPSPSAAPTAAPIVSSGGSSGGGGRRDPAPTPKPTATPVPELPPNAQMYVMNGLAESIDQVDLTSGTVTLDHFQTGKWPNQLWFDGTLSWLVNSGDATLDVIDLLTKTKETVNLPVGSNPWTIHKLTATTALLVNYLDSNGGGLSDVAFFNTATKTVTKVVDLPEGKPSGGAVVSGDKAYVPAAASTYLSVPPYTATFTFSGIYVIDLKTQAIIKTITLEDQAANPGELSLDFRGNIVFPQKGGLGVLNPTTDTVTQGLASATPLHSVRFFSADKAYAAVADGLVVFNPSTHTFIKGPSDKIPAGGDTSVGGFEIRGNRAYVPNFSGGTVTVVDLGTETIVGTPFAVGNGPQAVIFQSKPLEATP